jgi:hypothetical protein
MKLLLFTLITVFFISGCAVSGVTQKQLISADKLLENTIVKVDLPINGVNFQCSENLISMMISPLIPLPPLIPMFWISEDQVRIYVNPENIDSYLVEIKIEDDKSKVLGTYKIPSKDNVSLNLGFAPECSQLHNSKITLTEKDKTTGMTKSTSYLLKYEKSKMEFGWAYISA